MNLIYKFTTSLRASMCLSDTTVLRFNLPAEPARTVSCPRFNPSTELARTVGFGKWDLARTVRFGKRDSKMGFGNSSRRGQSDSENGIRKKRDSENGIISVCALQLQFQSFKPINTLPNLHMGTGAAASALNIVYSSCALKS
jgi:hypothetical protein